MTNTKCIVMTSLTFVTEFLGVGTCADDGDEG